MDVHAAAHPRRSRLHTARHDGRAPSGSGREVPCVCRADASGHAQAVNEMGTRGSCVTIHMAASLDGFIARRDGSVDWLETSDHFEDGEAMAPEAVAEFLRTIDCYVM